MASHAQNIWQSAFNSAYEQYDGDEEKSFAVAWAAVKKQYTKEGEEWVKKAMEPTPNSVHVPGISDGDEDEKMKKMMQKMMGDMMQNIMSGMMLVPKDGSKSKMKSIIDLHGIRLIDTTEIDIKGLTEGAPIQIMCVGEWSHPEYGDFSITEGDVAKFVENFEKGKRELVIDYEHLSADGNIQGPVPAAGWIRKLLNKGKQGLWAIPYWTKRAVDYIVNGEYRFLSPEFDFAYTNKQGKQQGQTVFASALTNRPFLEGMSPVMLSEGWKLAEWTAAKQKQKKEEVSMDNLILQELELPEDSAIEIAITAIRKLKEGVKNMENSDKLKEEVKKLSDLVIKDQEEIKRLAEKSKTLEDKLRDKEMDEVINKALKEGRIIPVLKDHYVEWYKIDPERTTKLLSELPPIVDLGIRGADGDSVKVKEGMELVEEEIAKKMTEAKIDYAGALTMVFKEKPELYKIYREAQGFKT